MDGQFISQIRSWMIMREYFDIEQPGTVFIPLKWPERIEKAADELVKKSNELQKKRIQMN